MIDIETLAFIEMLNELAANTNNDFVPFSEYTYETASKFGKVIVYDDTKGEPYDDDGVSYPICLGIHIDDIHHDVYAYYGECGDVKCNVRCVIPNSIDTPFIDIREFADDDYTIVVEYGRWHFA